MTYQCAASTRWTVEACGITLINPKTGKVCVLTYPQAAIWDLLTRSYAYNQTVRMVEAITALQSDEVKKLICESLEAWTETGFLIKGNNNGESFHHNCM